MSINVCFIKSNKNRLVEKSWCSRSGSKSDFTSRIIALGNFDGLHLGHQKLFNKVIEYSKVTEEGQASTAAIISFYPHPRYVLSKSTETKSKFEKLISPLRTRISKLNDFGIDELFAVRFSKSLAAFKPNEFIEKVILPLNPRMIIVGEDWCFGKNREGDVNTLIDFGKLHGFNVEVVSLRKSPDNNTKIGSSQVRKLIDEGEVSELSKLLGSPFSIYGKVIKGDGRGRKIGFPTVNIHNARQKYPANGVYATSIIIDGKPYKSISNVGIRPTFKPKSEKVHLETHIFDFDKDLYGKYVEVCFEERVRGEMAFSSVEELLAQIVSDIKHVKSL